MKNNPHLTAKERSKISFPTNWLLRNNLIKGTVLDFGCGYGADVNGLQDNGYDCVGYDTHYQPNFPDTTFDTIICQYVFNVLEIQYQESLLLHITSLLKPCGCAYITVRRDVKYEGYRTHKIHNKTTYQRNVILNFPSVFSNDFCEIYKIQRYSDIPKESTCIFCRPSKRLNYIAESTNTLAIYDGYPVSKGHALIVPKAHIADYFDIQPILQAELNTTLTFVKKKLQKELNPDGFNVGININEAAGQTIFHLHIHLIPRYKGDVPNPRGGVRHIIAGKGYY